MIERERDIAFEGWLGHVEVVLVMFVWLVLYFGWLCYLLDLYSSCLATLLFKRVVCQEADRSCVTGSGEMVVSMALSDL